MKTILTKAALTLGMAAMAGAAAAQDFTATPTYGSTNLDAGFLPDPHIVELDAGGSISAQDFRSECRGYIANAPDYSVYYTAGVTSSLIFNVDSQADTTLVINDPSGGWHCDDDGADEPFNPLIRFSDPETGRYDVWVGTYSDTGTEPATLFVSEIGENTRQSTDLAGGYGRGLDIGATAVYGNAVLSGGFLPDPYQINVDIGGPIDIDDAVGNRARGSCRGYTTTAPTLQLNYTGGSDLHIYTHGSSDTTLAINAPDGSWHCSDDEIGTDAGISFDPDASGTYDIYVGVYSSGSRASTTLRVSEIELGYSPSRK